MGVFLGALLFCYFAIRLPHARGGVSATTATDRIVAGSSPRTWGCFLLARHNRRRAVVFPTHVGVFLRRPFSRLCSCRLPHARGGVSRVFRYRCLSRPSSPRTWGCFYSRFSTAPVDPVFPTHVGVFLQRRSGVSHDVRLPHARGGVSQWINNVAVKFGSSPRTWGCFLMEEQKRYNMVVFPTHVGVFLETTGETPSFVCLPHARGGVSEFARHDLAGEQSSPHMWGCFLPALTAHGDSRSVFPMHAGFSTKRNTRIRINIL